MMKKLAWAPLVLLTASAVPAAVLNVTCVAAGQVTAAGTTQWNCNTALTSDPGSYLATLAVRGIGSWSDSNTGDLHQLQFVWTTAANGALSGTSSLTRSTGIDDFTGTTAPIASGTSTNFIGTGTTSFTGGANFVSLATSLIGGTTAFPDAQASTRIELIATQASTVPEPSTFALLGTVLVGLGFARRRK